MAGDDGWRAAMSTTLARHVEDYLRLRRSLGFKLRREGQVLAQFVAYLEAAGMSTVTTELAVRWACLPTSVHPVTWTQRLGAVRGFATYLRTSDPATEIPARDLFPGQGKRPAPHIYSDAEIARLLQAARGLRPALRAATYETLLGLVAVTGLRISEALRLRRDDVDLAAGVLSVTSAKSGSMRLLPLHSSASRALRSYARLRDRLRPAARTDAFFVSIRGTALCYSPVRTTFIQLTTDIGLRTTSAAPRIHDLRHSFAVRTLLRWYQDGHDVEGKLTTLSAYLGHINPAGTYWYFSATPELLRLAAQRLAARSGGQP
jgi:integrase